MARYVLAASPIPGHVTPLVSIGRDLQERGHHVRVLTGAQYHDVISEHGMQPVELPASAHPRRQPFCARANWLGPPSIVNRWLRGRTEMRSVFIAPMAAQYAALSRALRRDDVDAVLCDVAFTGALPLILSHRRRPPVLVCGVGPLTLSSADTPPFGIGWQPRPNANYRTMSWVVQHILLADIQFRLNRALRKVGVERSPVFLTDWPLLADRVLQLTVPATEYPRSDLPSSVTFTGPVIAGRESHHNTAVGEMAWGGRKVVHVTQGTWDNCDLSELIRPTIDALADRDDLIVVATTGRAGDPRIAGPIPSNTYVTDYAPYTSLLPHVDVMITNGGYGRTARTRRWCFADQFGPHFLDRRDQPVLLIESRSVFARRRFHRRTAHLILSALRHRAAELGDQVTGA